jgi:hypothetical protein
MKCHRWGAAAPPSHSANASRTDSAPANNRRWWYEPSCRASHVRYLRSDPRLRQRSALRKTVLVRSSARVGSPTLLEIKRWRSAAYVRYISASQFKRSCRREWLENCIANALVPFSDSQVFHYSIQAGVTARNEAIVFSMSGRGCVFSRANSGCYS